MRILVVSNLYPPFHGGGYGIICYRICTLLAGRGHQLLVLSSRPDDLCVRDSTAPEFLELPAGLEVARELRWVDSLSPLRLAAYTLENRRTVTRQARDWRPDLVYSFGMDGVGFDTYDTLTHLGIPDLTLVGDTWLAQAWRDLPRFDPWVGIAAARSASGLPKLAKRLLAGWVGTHGTIPTLQPRRQGVVQCISRYLLDDLIEAGAPLPPASCVIPCHLMPEFFTRDGAPLGHRGARTAQLRALFVSRMELPKGPDTAIEGVARACKGGADVTLTLVGLRSQSMREQLDELARRHGIAERVRWQEAPDTATLIKIYREHDVYLFPSRIAEGFGQVNTEAMACGLPVLGTGIGGSGELIREGITGLRFPPGDAQSLAHHLQTLAGNRDLLEQLARGALEQAAQYHPDSIMDRIEQLLQQVAADPTRRAS